MSNIQAQIWNGSTFAIECNEGNSPRSVIFRFSGPFTARDMYKSLTPLVLRNIFELELMASEEPPSVHVFDLTEVPYMDSAGLGMIVSHHVRCQSKSIRMIAAGVSPRVRELFKITKVDTFIPMAGTVEEAEAR